jgi:SAM-dependent methyltransferase
VYDEAAPYYDLFAAGRGRDADREATLVLAEIRRLLAGRPLRTLLDVGCGTGAHLPRFVEAGLSVVGVDPSRSMLRMAAERAPSVELWVASLPDLDVGGRRFDAVVSLFSVIGYVSEDGGLAEAVAAMAGALEDGGCLLVEGWVEPEFWIGSTVGAEAVTTPELAVTRTVVSGLDGHVASLHVRHVVARPGERELTTIDEHHRLRLTDPSEVEAAFAAAGLTFERLPHLLHDGRSVYVGVRT